MTREEFLNRIFNDGDYRLKDIYQMCRDKFGESKVDFQWTEEAIENADRFNSLQETSYEELKKRLNSHILSAYIFIYFPEVKVTNEYGQFHSVRDLYVRFIIENMGTLKLGITMNKTTFTKEEFNHDYVHSHCPGYISSRPECFQSCCLGSGPIRNTIAQLNHSYDEDMWRMFFVEVEQYVHVESLEGGPYRLLSELTDSSFAIGTRDVKILFRSLTTIENYRFAGRSMKDFIKYIIDKKVLKFKAVDGVITLGISIIDAKVLISNLMIEWINIRFREGYFTARMKETLINQFTSVYYMNNELYIASTISSSNNNFEAALRCNGQNAFIFKGEMKKVRILNITEVSPEDNTVLILDNRYFVTIVSIILTYINCFYGQSFTIEECAGI